MKKIKAAFISSKSKEKKKGKSKHSAPAWSSATSLRDREGPAAQSSVELGGAMTLRPRSLTSPESLPDVGDRPASLKRRTVLAELVYTEEQYVTALKHMLLGYKEPLSGVLTDAQITAIFSIADLIYDFHCGLAAGLAQHLEQWTDQSAVGEYFLQKVAFLRSYSVYVNNYTNAVSTLSALEADSPDFAEQLQQLRRRGIKDDEQPLQSLYSYLVMPIQRVPRYLLLLERLKKYTPSEHPDSRAIEQAIAGVSETAAYIDTKRDQYERNHVMLALSVALQGVPAGFSVLDRGRTMQHCCEAALEVRPGKSMKVRAVLLSDGLLLAKRKGSKTKATLSRVASSSSFDAVGADQLLASSCKYVDWMSFERPDAVTVTNYGAGWFSVGDGARLLTFCVAGQERSLLELVCDALKRPVPAVVPRETPVATPRRGSFILGLRSSPTHPSPFISLAELSRSHLAPIAATPSASTPPAASSSAAASPLATSHGDSALSPRLATLLGRRPRTKSDPPTMVSPVLARSAIAVAHNTWHDHATLVAAGFVDRTALPLPQPPLSWAEVESDHSAAVASHVELVPDHRYELGGRQLRPNLVLPPQFMYPELLGTFYQHQLAEHAHVVFFGDTPDKKDPVIVTVETAASGLPYRRAVLRSKHGETRTVLPMTCSVDDCLAHLQRDCSSVLAFSSPRAGPMHWLRLSPDAMPQTVLSPRDARNRWCLAERLADYDADQQRMFTQLKIGVVPTKPGDMEQLSDRRLFATSAASPAFQEFLDFLGDTVALRGYDGFAGGLDTTADMTGSHSVHAAFDSAGQRFDIMFHVSTLLPHVDGDEQQLAKKRHIGNDIVVVVFHEDNEPFDPRVFISKMNQVFLVVRKTGSTDDGRPIYRLAFVCKDQAPSLPVLPSRPDFEASPAFRRFLLAKLINAEATTHQTCLTFVARNRRARISCLQEIIDAYAPPSPRE